MAHGLPVIASEVGAARAVIGAAGERGLLVPPGDPAALALALARLLASSPDESSGGLSDAWSNAPRDWPALRGRCHDYVQSRTLETWAERLGQFCASQWGLSFVNGKLGRPL
jgi:glycosyltransferase involved in cell wall biosynthesis